MAEKNKNEAVGEFLFFQELLQLYRDNREKIKKKYDKLARSHLSCNENRGYPRTHQMPWRLGTLAPLHRGTVATLHRPLHRGAVAPLIIF